MAPIEMFALILVTLHCGVVLSKYTLYLSEHKTVKNLYWSLNTFLFDC